MEVQDRTYKELWELYYDLERTCRYYEVIHSRATRSFLYLRIGTLTLLAVGAVALLNLLPLLEDTYAAMVAGLLAVALAALTVIDFAFNLPRRAAIALSIKVSLAHLRVDVEHLWREVYEHGNLTEEELRPRLRDLTLHWQELEGMAKAHDILTNDKLNKKTSLEAHQVLKERYMFDTSGTTETNTARTSPAVTS